MGKKVLAIPDLHAPWTDTDALCYLYSITQELKPDIIIQLGDALDMFSYSKFPHDPNIMTPDEEMREGRELLTNMWLNLAKMAPKASFVQLLGNHCLRLKKRVLEAIPSVLTHVNWVDLFKFKNVKLITDSREEYQIDQVIYIHGHLTGIGAHMRYYRQSIVHGHTHRASINFMTSKKSQIFELDCGHLADDKNGAPMQYSTTKTTHWVKAFGFIDDMGPRLFPIP